MSRSLLKILLLLAQGVVAAGFQVGSVSRGNHVGGRGEMTRLFEVPNDRFHDRGLTGSPHHLPELSRREWFTTSFAALGAGTAMISSAVHALESNTTLVTAQKINRTALPEKKLVNLTKVARVENKVKTTSATPEKKFAPVNLTKVAAENKVNVSLVCDSNSQEQGCVSVDHRTFNKVKQPNYPNWIPSWLQPKPRVIKTIPDSELLVAAIVAGSATEIVRTIILYPLGTVKTRVQAVEGSRRSWRWRRGKKRKPELNIRRRLDVVKYTFLSKVREGNLYNGVLNSILVSVPCAGVYYGVRDITKRALTMTMITPTRYDDIAVSLIGAIVADVVKLIVRAPADVRSTRLRVAPVDKDGEIEDEEEVVGDWFSDAVQRLPAVILTDLPYLLTRIALNGLILQGSEGFARYELIYVTTACTCAILTTPFDVARTRILVDSNDDPTDGIDGGSGEGLLMTMQTVMDESEGGARNLFRGWFERLLYFGIAAAWLQPFFILSYVGIRDAVLLEWFD